MTPRWGNGGIDRIHPAFQDFPLLRILLNAGFQEAEPAMSGILRAE